MASSLAQATGTKAGLTKSELISLHLAAYKTRRRLEQLGLATSDQFAAYDALGIDPMNIDRRRDAHTHAIHVLTACIHRVLDGERPDRRRL